MREKSPETVRSSEISTPNMTVCSRDALVQSHVNDVEKEE
jgi:hypothetical protein